MIEIGKTGLDITDIPEQPIHDIDKMGELGEKRSAVQRSITMPATGFIITFVTVPIAVQLNHVYFTQLAGVDHILNPHGRRGITVLHDAKYLFTVFQRSIYHLLRISQCQRHRFFYHHITTGFDGLYRHRRMQTVRSTDINDIYLNATLQ